MAGIIMGRNQIGVNEIGTTVSISQDPRAQLMFYLKCISNVLDLEGTGNIARLTKYSDYFLTEEQELELFLLCALLSPDVLVDKCLFHDEEICGDSKNKFFEIAAVQERLLVTGDIMIGNQSRQVRKIMFFKGQFLKDNYLDPMVHFNNKFESQKREEEQQRELQEEEEMLEQQRLQQQGEQERLQQLRLEQQRKQQQQEEEQRLQQVRLEHQRLEQQRKQQQEQQRLQQQQQHHLRQQQEQLRQQQEQQRQQQQLIQAQQQQLWQQEQQLLYLQKQEQERQQKKSRSCTIL